MKTILENKQEFFNSIPQANEGDEIVLGITNFSFHRCTGAIVAYVLTKMGFKVTCKYAHHEENFRRLKDGEIDMLASAWIPSNHGIYRDLVAESTPILELGCHYTPYALWGVPNYIPKDEVNSIADLLKPDIIAKMNTVIQGINIGAGITRFSLKMMEEYGLTDAGYEFKLGEQQLCVDAFEDAAAKGEWAIVPLWQPQFLHNKYHIRELEDPKGLLGSVDKAVLLVSKQKADAIFTADQLNILDQIILSNEIVSELDYAYCRQGMSADDAVQFWLRN